MSGTQSKGFERIYLVTTVTDGTLESFQIHLPCSTVRLSQFRLASVQSRLLSFGLGCRSLRSGEGIVGQDVRHDQGHLLVSHHLFVSALDDLDIVANL